MIDELSNKKNVLQYRRDFERTRSKSFLSDEVTP